MLRQRVGGQAPSVWRTAVIKPLHKSASASAEEFTNYRPISLRCCSLKTLKKCPRNGHCVALHRMLMKVKRVFAGVPKNIHILYRL